MVTYHSKFLLLLCNNHFKVISSALQFCIIFHRRLLQQIEAFKGDKKSIKAAASNGEKVC